MYVVKVRKVVYDKELSNKYIKKQLYGLCIMEEITVLEHSNFFKKVISELLAVDVKINEEEKTLILLSLLQESYNHIATTMFYDEKTLILEEITPTLLSNNMKKGQIKLSRK